MDFKSLESACKKFFSIANIPLLTTQIKLEDCKKWPTNNNVAMHRHTLEDFVRWFVLRGILMYDENWQVIQ